MNSAILPAHRSGVLLVVLSSCCVGVAPILMKIGLSEKLDPVALLTLRMVIASIALWIGFYFFYRKMIRMRGIDLLFCFLLGLLNCGASLCYINSLLHIKASIATVIVSCYPAMVLILMALKGEKATKTDGLRLSLMLIGVYVLIGPGGNVDMFGTILAFLAAFFYAVFLALMQWFPWTHKHQTVSLHSVSFMALVMMAVFSFRSNGWALPSTYGWAVVVSLGVVSTALARLAIFAGIHKIGSAQAALLSPLETLITVILAYMLLGEKLSGFQWVGAAMMIISGVLLILNSPKMKRKKLLLEKHNG